MDPEVSCGERFLDCGSDCVELLWLGAAIGEPNSRSKRFAFSDLLLSCCGVDLVAGAGNPVEPVVEV